MEYIVLIQTAGKLPGLKGLHIKKPYSFLMEEGKKYRTMSVDKMHLMHKDPSTCP